MKKLYRFFGGFLDTQEKWLNKMAKNGYRLVKTGKLNYEFRQCEPDEYTYAVEFVAHHSYKSEKEYRAFLEDMGYKVFYKNINLRFVVGKVKWRPYGKGMGQISTSPGNFNKELFIIEKKKDGKPFELHTTHADRADYYKPLRNAWLSIAATFLGLGIGAYLLDGSEILNAIILGTIGLVVGIPVLQYQKRIAYHRSEAHVEE